MMMTRQPESRVCGLGLMEPAPGQQRRPENHHNIVAAVKELEP